MIRLKEPDARTQVTKELTDCCAWASAQGIFNVRCYGAKGEGKKRLPFCDVNIAQVWETKGPEKMVQWIEWIAAIAGAVSVYLAAREKISSWPTAIVNVSLYIFIFYESGLYSDMGLQVVYLILSIYGWYQWLHGGQHRSRLHVSHATLRMWAVASSIGLIFWLGLARYTSTLSGVSYPLLDSGLTTLSLIAQWMMTRKIIENWVLWIIADILYVPMYLAKGLYVTAMLYALFLVLAAMGLIHWRRSFARDHAVVPGLRPTLT
jgi:nicotinamide mononucleotide transporter